MIGSLSSDDGSAKEHISVNMLGASSLPELVAFTFAKKLLVTYVHVKAVKSYSSHDRRKKIMISHNENDFHRQGFDPLSLDSQSNVLPIALTGRGDMTAKWTRWPGALKHSGLYSQTP